MPVIAYILLEAGFNGLEMVGLFEEATPSALIQRERTLALLAVCCNIFPFNYCRKKRWDNAMRGMVFPTIIYAAAWVYRYHDILF